MSQDHGESSVCFVRLSFLAKEHGEQYSDPRHMAPSRVKKAGFADIILKLSDYSLGEQMEG